jgi:hypothetical protein
MEQDDLLRFLVGALERLGLPYLVTGSMATIFWGEPRFTNDIDVVVQLPAEGVAAFLREFPAPDFYVDEESVRGAVARRRQFNVIHPASGLKVDVMVPVMDELDRSRFQRARRVEPGPGLTASFASPEDVILKKLQYFDAGGSERHLRDIAGMLRVSGNDIDREYVTRWADRLGLDGLWKQVLDGLRSE